MVNEKLNIQNADDCHIGKFDEDMCQKVIELMSMLNNKE